MISWTKLLFDTDNPKKRFHLPERSVKPVIVWNLTPSCNLSCSHCYIEASKGHSPDFLDTDKCKKIISDLAEFGVPVILFSGGEPLLRKDFFELAHFTRDSGIRAVLSTNGTLINEGIAERIKESGVEYAGISIDGREGTHDTLRGAKGAFKLASDGVRNCRESGIKTGVRFSLMKDNAKDLEFIFDFVRNEGINRLCIYHLVYSGRADRAGDILFSEKRKALELIWNYTNDFYSRGADIEVLTVDNHADGAWIYLKMLNEDKEKAQGILKTLILDGGNQSGASIGCIDYRGNVFIDQFTRGHSLGNLCERKFGEIWVDEENQFLYNLRHRGDFIKGRCRHCKFFPICNGNMRSRAEKAFADFWQEDPACYLEDREINAYGYKADILGNYAGL